MEERVSLIEYYLCFLWTVCYVVEALHSENKIQSSDSKILFPRFQMVAHAIFYNTAKPCVSLLGTVKGPSRKRHKTKISRTEEN